GGAAAGAAAPATTGPRRPATSGPAARSGARRTHKVVRGDTLYGIARKYGVRPAEIRAANKMDTDTVEIGQTLVIPGGS
ncbi:MAG TPA: LysM peptidoglycan-binding domain-containing protein, partial [Longimicrobiaceae bacterium]|nr:LysM peptidoglycan-binding domain-containing protein [Longimicrobiaceae bacterium]